MKFEIKANKTINERVILSFVEMGNIVELKRTVEKATYESGELVWGLEVDDELIGKIQPKDIKKLARAL